jgi:predicted transcriptional regulator
MIPKRSKMEIIHDMLSVIGKFETVGPTKIIYKANLSHDRFKEYIAFLKTRELVDESSQKGKTFYTLTLKGKDFLSKFRQVQELSEAFGLPL